MLPSLRRVGVLADAANPEYANVMLDEVLRAGGPTGTEIQPVVTVQGPNDLENAFATFARERAGALVVQGGLAIKPVSDMALNYRLPAASTARAFAEIGGLMSQRRPGVEGHDHINLEADQLGRELGKSIQLPFRGAKLKCDILSLHIAKFAQSFTEFLGERLRIGCSNVERAYSSHLRLLGMRRERSGDRGTQQCDELAPSHGLPLRDQGRTLPHLLISRRYVHHDKLGR
jgi:hypothetical protein